MHELDAAVMVVDVSGFSGMCERFAQGLIPDGGWRQRMQVGAACAIQTVVYPLLWLVKVVPVVKFCGLVASLAYRCRLP